jgi:hypothetical protein
MADRARGTFEVQPRPRATNGEAEGGPIGRMPIDQFVFGFVISETP